MFRTLLITILLIGWNLNSCHVNAQDEDPIVFPGRTATTSYRVPGRKTTPTRSPKFVTPSTISPTDSPVTLPIENYNTCIAGCPKTSEYNPVCGTDNNGYANPSMLRCEKLCRLPALEMQNYGRCPEVFFTTES